VPWSRYLFLFVPHIPYFNLYSLIPTLPSYTYISIGVLTETNAGGRENKHDMRKIGMQQKYIL